jgi:hypothetical protein
MHLLGERSKLRDHSILTFEFTVDSQSAIPEVKENVKKTRFNYRQIAMNFRNSNTAIDAINRFINIIELCRKTQSEIGNTHDLFCESVFREMTETIPKYDWSTKT